jgi:NAD(P)-dependent dehydrogenase (short-subunit alcohol dehydrogenase family)
MPEVVGSGRLARAISKLEEPGFVWCGGKHDMQASGKEVEASFDRIAEDLFPALDHGRNVVLIGSLASEKVLSGAPYYVVGHHMVLGLMRALAVRFAGKVAVNMVCPGNVEGGMKCTLGDEERTKRKLAGQPMGRFIEVDEVVQTVRWLLTCPVACTGNLVYVAGGRQVWEKY